MTRIPCVGAVILDDAGRLLLVKRANEPARGLWSIPGGRVEAGESPENAVVREVREETGLDVEIAAAVGTIERDAPGGATFVIEDYACRIRPDSPDLTAGDDAQEARWVGRAELRALRTSPGLVGVLADWGCLPTAP